jgi:hypothetical protein
MNSGEIFDIFRSISVRQVGERYSPYKPLLLLYALSQCYLGKDRLYSYSEIDHALNKVVDRLFVNFDYRNFHYAFGRLKNDNIWEISSNDSLKFSSSGDLLKSELLDKNISGGFTEEIYQALKEDKDLILFIVNYILTKYFSDQIHSQLLSHFSFSIKDAEIHPKNIYEIKPTYKNKKFMDAINSGENHMAERQNGYIAYLNSLHNVSANGANALAESQALNIYFTEIYQPFPLVEDLYKSLTERKERVVILTGHAGDGKSTVALDVLKRLRQLPADKPLDYALNEREETIHANGRVTIVKDMSELTDRKQYGAINS